MSRNCQKQLLRPSHYHLKHTAFMTVSGSFCFSFFSDLRGDFLSWRQTELWGLIHEVRQGNSSWRAAAQQQPLRSSQITSGCKQHWPVPQQQGSLSTVGQHEVCTRGPPHLSTVLDWMRSRAGVVLAERLCSYSLIVDLRSEPDEENQTNTTAESRWQCKSGNLKCSGME